VLEVEGLNAHLRSLEEQYLLNEQFQQLLVALPHPLQVLMRIVPIDLQGYLSSFTLTPSQETGAFAFDGPAQKHMVEIWTQLATSHVEFMQNRAARTPLLERRFYLVIPALVDSIQEGTETTFTHLLRREWRRKEARAATASRAQHQLTIRCEALERQLSSMSLLTHRLTDRQLMELISTCLRPREARNFPLLSSWIDGIDRLVTMDHERPSMAHQSNSLTDDQLQWPLHTVISESPIAEKERGGETPIRWPMVADSLAPACIEIKPDHIQIEQDHVQVLDVHTLPRQVGPGWFNQLMRIDEVMDVSLFYIPQPPAATMRALRRKRFEMHSSTLLDQELVTLTRFWGVEEEKYGKLSRGGFNGQITTNVYQRIQAGSSKAF
jgi:hypothetical protein